ncbi:LysR family transcriptional regulator [Lucifera butyrica]|uniref:LysR family transcriptional regulator n=1 Tax=Lucifera butyrica TaxID=1351585 RepID=UPI000F019670|nr:LysR family transcriptional regulator [Lucifera butyrica]
MDIRHLIYFAEVARCQSFTKASQTLHITQPSISKMIKTLEDELGVVLFDRSGKQVELTDAGKAVLNQSRQIIASMQNLTSELADVINLEKGNLVIGLPPMVGARFFPNAIGEFKKIYPRITIQLKEFGSKKIEQGVEEGTLDIGVAVLPVKENTFDLFSFVKEPVMLIVHPCHPLAAKSGVFLEELRREPFIFFHKDFALHDMILDRCALVGFQPRIICESYQWDFMAEMVAANLGIALLPQRVCRELDPGRITMLPLLDPMIPWHLAIIWKKDKYLSFATRKWLDFTRSLLGTE